MKYKCSQCGKPVIVIPEHNPIKGCKCKAPIIADMGAGLEVKGGLKVGK